MVNQEEILKLWERVFIALNAGWYNWAVSSSLKEKNNYPWSTITAIYSIHSLSHVPIYLSEGIESTEEELVVLLDEREKLANFYLNLCLPPEQSKIRFSFLNRLSIKTGLSSPVLDKKVRLLGELMKLDDVEEQFWVENNARVIGNVLKANSIVSNLIRFTIENCHPPERYIILLYLQEELKVLYQILKSKKISRISDWDFNQFIEEFSQFIHSELVFLKEIELPLVSQQKKDILAERNEERLKEKIRNNSLSLLKDWQLA